MCCSSWGLKELDLTELLNYIIDSAIKRNKQIDTLRHNHTIEYYTAMQRTGDYYMAGF